MSGSSVAVAPWAALLSGPEAERAVATARDIAGAVVAATAPLAGADRATTMAEGTAGLAGGPAGVAVFLGEMARHDPDGPWVDAASDLLDVALDDLSSSETLDLGLFTGATGVAWALAHLEGVVVEPDEDDNDVDDLIAKAVALPRWPGQFDLILGLVGLGTYCLERLPRPTARTSLGHIVRHLVAQAVEVDGGLAWRTSARSVVDGDRRIAFPDGYWDTGMAHGAAGVVAFLAAATTVGVPGAAEACRAAVTWLLAQRLPEGLDGAYPLIFDGRVGNGPGRQAWCYGDPGVAVGLLAAGEALGDDEVLAEARRVTRLLATVSYEVAGASDAALCHGAGGLAHALNRLGQGLGEEVALHRARQWVDAAHRMRMPDEPCAGFLSARPHADGSMTVVPLPGLLEGAAGVGLALLGAATAVEPSWDAALLLRPPSAWSTR